MRRTSIVDAGCHHGDADSTLQTVDEKRAIQACELSEPSNVGQLNPFSICCDALCVETTDAVRSVGANKRLPKTRPDAKSATPNSVSANPALAGNTVASVAQTAPDPFCPFRALRHSGNRRSFSARLGQDAIDRRSPAGESLGDVRRPLRSAAGHGNADIDYVHEMPNSAAVNSVLPFAGTITAAHRPNSSGRSASGFWLLHRSGGGG